MARRPSAAELERRAARARARESFVRPPRPAGTAVQQRGATSEFFYRSLLRKSDATTHQLFSVNVEDTTITAFGGAANAGLLADPGADTVLNTRRTIKPTRAHWYRGRATPISQVSPWGSGWTQYYDNDTHRSVPFSRVTGAFDARDLKTAFNTLFGEGGSARGLLGGVNGRAYLDLEKELDKSNTET